MLNGTYCSGRVNFGILVSTLYDPLGSKFLSISLDVRSIVLQNSVFGKVGRVASEEVIRYNCKCLPVLFYGLEACSLSKSDLSSIDFAFNRFFMKLFRTNNIETVKVCQFVFWYISSKRCFAQ